MRWLFDQYYRSPDFQMLAPATRRDKKSVLERYIEPIDDLNFKQLKRKHVLQSQLKRAHIPGAADKLVKYLKKLFNWAIEEGFAEFNPATGIAKINTGTGFSTWHTVQIEKFRRHYPRDHKARLAFEILLNTGARISDAVALTSLNLQNGRVEFVPHKTRNNPASRVSLPITEVLANLLKLHPLDGKALILNEHGNPFSVDGFGNRMRKWCDAAGIKDLSSHGLRKAAATALAEAGASERELMAVFGWTDSKTAATYVQTANKRQLSDNAFARISDAQTSKNVPLFKISHPSGTNEEKNDENSMHFPDLIER